MLSYLVPAALLALSASPARGETDFLQPPGAGPFGNFRDNPIYEVGERMDVQWESDLSFMDVILWQDYPSAGGGNSWFRKLSDNTRSTSMIWTVSFEMFSIDGLEDGEDSVFYFSIYEADVDKVVATSHYFNVTYEQADKIETTTASKADPTSHSSESTSTSTSTSEAISTTSTSAPASTTTGSDPENLVGDEKDSGGSGGLSTGAVAGISVGATLGGIAAIVGLGYFLWKRRRANKGVSQPPTEPGVSTPLAPFEYYKPDGQGTPAMSQYPPSQYPPSQYPPSQYPPSQAAAATTTERSELGDNGWNAPPHGAHRANAIGGIHEVP